METTKKPRTIWAHADQKESARRYKLLFDAVKFTHGPKSAQNALAVAYIQKEDPDTFKSLTTTQVQNGVKACLSTVKKNIQANKHDIGYMPKDFLYHKYKEVYLAVFGNTEKPVGYDATEFGSLVVDVDVFDESDENDKQGDDIASASFCSFASSSFPSSSSRVRVRRQGVTHTFIFCALRVQFSRWFSRNSLESQRK